jgi:hypothetical protein
VAGPLRPDALLVARAQDAAGWLTLAVVLLLAPWDGPYDLAGLPSPHPPLAWQAGGAALAAAAVLLWRSRSRRAIALAAAADVAGVAAVVAWLASRPGLGTRGTIVAAGLAIALAIQAAADVVLLVSERRTGGRARFRRPG